MKRGVSDRATKAPEVADDYGRPERVQPKRWTALLISADDVLYNQLRLAANSLGHLVVKTEQLQGVLAVFQAVKPTVALLDLDFPDHQAWQATELLLEQPTCPPMVLLTAHAGQFARRTAIRAGAFVDKNRGPSGILRAVEESLSYPETNPAQRNAIRRVLIRWLKPARWTDAIAPAYRFWGINE